MAILRRRQHIWICLYILRNACKTDSFVVNRNRLPAFKREKSSRPLCDGYPSLLRIDPRCLDNRPPFLRSAARSSDRDQEKKRSSFSGLSITELLEQVDKRGLRYSPTTRRHDLERMLLEHDQQSMPHLSADMKKSGPRNIHGVSVRKKLGSPTDASKESFMTSTSANTKRAKEAEPHAIMPLAKVLAELDRRAIRYSPTSTPQELRELLARHVHGESDSHVTNEKTYSHATAPPTITDGHSSAFILESDTEASSLSLSDILKQLDDRDIRFAPTATQEELLLLLQQASQEDSKKDRSTVPATILAQRQKQHRRRARVKQKQQQSSSSSSSSSVIGSLLSSQLSTKATKSLGKAIRNAKLLSRKANDFLFTDEDGVRDVAFEYVQRDDVMALRLKKAQDVRRKNAKGVAEKQQRQTESVQRVPRPSHVNATGQSRLPPTTPIERSRTIAGDSLSDDAVGASNRRANRRRSDPSRPRIRSLHNESTKRIYSPYGADTSSYKDDFDRFGDFIADSADKIMWGSYDDKINETDHLSREPRHWKDRLEERFDYILGIHNDGEYYNSWTRKDREDQAKEGGFDAMSVARGRKPRRRGVVSGKKSNKAIWEQDNLISLLFGKSSNGRGRRFDKMMSPNGSILNLFSAVFRSGIIIASYLCRWASCRGALPQPVVVVGMSTAILCARPRYRFRIVAMTLIVTRAVGELLHGYVYGDDGWEDDEDDGSVQEGSVESED